MVITSTRIIVPCARINKSCVRNIFLNKNVECPTDTAVEINNAFQLSIVYADIVFTIAKVNESNDRELAQS